MPFYQPQECLRLGQQAIIDRVWRFERQALSRRRQVLSSGVLHS